MAVTASDLARELQELITALDRRVPRVEQAGEDAIARDAAALREKALKRLRELDEPHGIAALEPSNRSTQVPMQEDDMARAGAIASRAVSRARSPSTF